MKEQFNGNSVENREDGLKQKILAREKELVRKFKGMDGDHKFLVVLALVVTSLTTAMITTGSMQERHFAQVQIEQQKAKEALHTTGVVLAKRHIEEHSGFGPGAVATGLWGLKTGVVVGLLTSNDEAFKLTIQMPDVGEAKGLSFEVKVPKEVFDASVEGDKVDVKYDHESSYATQGTGGTAFSRPVPLSVLEVKPL